MPLRINGLTTGSVTLAAPNTGTDVTLTLPTTALATESFASSAPGLQLITTQNFSTASTISVNNCFTNAYQHYRITFNLTAASTDLTIFMRMRVGGSDNTSVAYRSQQLYQTSTTIAGVLNPSSVGSSQMYVTGTIKSTDPTSCAMAFDMFNPQAAAWSIINGTCFIYGTDTLSYNVMIASAFFGTTSFDGFSLITSTGTISGILRVYGYKN